MKNSKNIFLLTGTALTFAVFIYQILTCLIVYSGLIDVYVKDWAKTLLFSSLNILAFVFPNFLLIRNLKNKTGKALPIICLILCGAVCLQNIASLLIIPNIPQFLTISDIGILSFLLTRLVNFLKNGGLLSTAGYVLLLVGSALSLSKKQITAEEKSAASADI